MSDLNKKLAVKLTISVINAHPRTKITDGIGEDLVAGLSVESILNMLTKFYNALSSLDKKSK